jgi:prepilin-type N-terminal cleavage/methylation domain-containing protein
MKPKHTISATAAFTLVEMLVVIVIIGLLVAALLPAFGAARRQAQKASCAGMYSGLEQGIQQFQTEQALGGTLPPSTGDNPTRAQRVEIHDPGSETETPVKASGAQLLVMALIGADGLGTPGFRDLDGDGVWWNDTSAEQPAGAKRGGLYALDATTKEPKQTRYAGYVDSKMKEHLDSFTKLANDGKIVNKTLDQLKTLKYATNQLFFEDPWDAPVLYFRANRAGQRMVSKKGGPAGVYSQEDNAIITGCEDGEVIEDGLDFGAGKLQSPGADKARLHALSLAKSPDATVPVADLFDVSKPDWADTFARFVADPKVLVKPTPSRPDSYLLISAGPDGRYGTEDDVTNWTR